LPPSPSAALTIEEMGDIDLTTSWMYDTGANIHVGNDIKYFHNYIDVQPTHMATGSSSSAIHGYGEIQLSSGVLPNKVLFDLRVDWRFG
jgi:hypothetical protein